MVGDVNHLERGTLRVQVPPFTKSGKIAGGALRGGGGDSFHDVNNHKKDTHKKGPQPKADFLNYPQCGTLCGVVESRVGGLV